MGPSSLDTPLQFNRKVPALPDNLGLRSSSQHPIIIEKLKPSAGHCDLGLDRSGLQTSVPFLTISEEKLNLDKRDVKRKQLEELLKARFPQSQSQVPLKSGQKKSKLTDSWSDASKSKVQGLYPGNQFSSKVENTCPKIKVCLSPPLEKPVFPLSSSLPTAEPGPRQTGSRQAAKAVESWSMLELRRLQKELNSCIQKIEGVATKDNLEEGLNQSEAEQRCISWQEQALRTAMVLNGLQEQVKEIQEELDKLSPYKIKQTKKEQDSLLERKQSLRKTKEYFPGIQSQSPLGFPLALERSSSISPVRERTREKLPHEMRWPIIRRSLDDEPRRFSMFPLLQMLDDDAGSLPEEDFSYSDQNTIFKGKSFSTKAKAMKKWPLTTNGTRRRRGTRKSKKSQQV